VNYGENLHASRAIAACVDIPVSADADTGWGNAINVFFTVRGFEAASVDGIVLEDQVWPKLWPHGGQGSDLGGGGRGEDPRCSGGAA
jgi:2-methylisocitrate lyase-like PEP mutase family enzyme